MIRSSTRRHGIRRVNLRARNLGRFNQLRLLVAKHDTLIRRGATGDYVFGLERIGGGAGVFITDMRGFPSRLGTFDTGRFGGLVLAKRVTGGRSSVVLVSPEDGLTMELDHRTMSRLLDDAILAQLIDLRSAYREWQEQAKERRYNHLQGDLIEALKQSRQITGVLGEALAYIQRRPL